MRVFADLHIHIGRSGDGKPVKITAASSMTVENILAEASLRKGIQMVGIVDAGSPGVQADLSILRRRGLLEPLQGGGYSYNGVTLIPGMEVETSETRGAGHFVAYFPCLEQIKDFSAKMSRYISNIQLSTQRARLTLAEFWDLAADFGGLIIPAHIFTPHKSVYGACCDSLAELLRPDQLAELKAVELGLSSDTELAQLIGELGSVAFLSNSDAHSLPKIAREYNLLEVNRPDFENLLAALVGKDGCRIKANFGFDPKLGKYHRTFCEHCSSVAVAPPPVLTCPDCGSHKVVRGVLDRIIQLSQREKSKAGCPGDRPPYIHQIPLQFLPGLGAKTLMKLLHHFGTEMNVLHFAPQSELERAAGEDIARLILASRQGTLAIAPGGGGIYGKVLKE